MTESVRAETAELVRLGALIDKIYQGQPIRIGGMRFFPLPSKQLSATPIYRELNHPNGIDHVLTGTLFDFKSPGVIPTALTLYRSVGQPGKAHSRKMR